MTSRVQPPARSKPIYIVTVRVSEQYARDILTSAIDQGCAHWAGIRRAWRDNKQRIVKVKLVDYEADLPDPTADRPDRIVTAGGIKRAVIRILRDGDAIGAGGLVRRQVFEGDPDAPRCDAVLQVALFGSVLYS